MQQGGDITIHLLHYMNRNDITALIIALTDTICVLFSVSSITETQTKGCTIVKGTPLCQKISRYQNSTAGACTLAPSASK